MSKFKKSVLLIFLILIASLGLARFPPGSCLKNKIILGFRYIPPQVNICTLEIFQTTEQYRREVITLMKDRNRVWRTVPNREGYKYEILERADAQTFRRLGSEPPESNYFIDKNSAFFHKFYLEGSDIQTFEVLSDPYSKDHQHVYYGQTLISQAESETFTIIDQNFSKDKDHLYYGSKDIDGAYVVPQASLTSNPRELDPYYITDGVRLYYAFNREIHLIPEGDISTFERLKPFYAYVKDQRHVYHNQTRLDRADPATFQVLCSFPAFAKDKRQSYYENTVIPQASPATFEILERCLNDNYYSKDRFHVFYKSDVIPRADPQTITIKGRGYAVDAKHVYYNGSLVPLANPQTIYIYDDWFMTDGNYIFYQGMLAEGVKPTNFKNHFTRPEANKELISNVDGKFLVNFDDISQTVRV